MAPLEFITFNCVVILSFAEAANIIQPCKINDNSCVTNSVKTAYPLLVTGVPELNVESCDPMFIEEIQADLTTLRFKLSNTTAIGFKNCEVGKVKFDLDESLFSVDLTCSNLRMTGQYDVSGRLIIIPIEGNGDYNFKSKKFFIGVDTEIKKVEGKDGKSHLIIKKFKLRLQALEKFDVHLSNLFNGQKDLADAVINFANQSWREVTDLLKDPIFYPMIKKMVNSTNKYLKTVSFEDLFVK